MALLAQSFYERPTPQVARELLGKKIVRIWNGITLSGIISETEAYGAELDPASHAYKNKTARNKALFGPVGCTYIYFIYGVHFCLNIVARDTATQAGGVLIRAVIPLEGIETMHLLRRASNRNKLMSGPGNVAQALHLTLADNHLDVTHTGSLFIEEGITIPSDAIQETARIGISKGHEHVWRFVIPGKDIQTSTSKLIK